MTIEELKQFLPEEDVLELYDKSGFAMLCGSVYSLPEDLRYNLVQTTYHSLPGMYNIFREHSGDNIAIKKHLKDVAKMLFGNDDEHLEALTETMYSILTEYIKRKNEYLLK